MSENAEWYAKQLAWRTWGQTDLGKAFIAFESLHAKYWQMDGQDRVSDKRLTKADEDMRAARKALIAAIGGPV